MPVSAFRIFDYLDQHRSLTITRHEVACTVFARLRRSVYRLVVGLGDAETGDTDLSDRLRQSLSEWLTVPIRFADFHTAALDELGTSDFVGIRWGADLQACFDAALESVAALRRMESPLRLQLAEAIRGANAAGRTWRVYCHRSAAEQFVSCAKDAEVTISGDTFIHSLRDYRNAEPFDVLVKVGPLRSRGWGSFPGACLNAPRYRELTQIVWDGMDDEQGFGDDPLMSAWSVERTSTEELKGRRATGSAAATSRWSRTIIPHPDLTTGKDGASTGAASIPDELQAFSAMQRMHVPRRALLLHIGRGLGLFYPPHAEVLLLSPGPPRQQSVLRCELTGVDPRGHFLVRADIGDVSMGAHASDHGWYSTRWKAELRRRFEHHAEGLLRELRAAGITLRNLRDCVEHWIQPATTVIHAPQQRRHFGMLIDVLEMESRAPRPSEGRKPTAGPWWLGAWEEIGASRGLAIQFGMQEQEIIGEEVDRIVLSILPELEQQAADREPFRVPIPSGHSLEGSISFLPIREVETGYCVPDSLLKTMIQVSRAEEWRA